MKTTITLAAYTRGNRAAIRQENERWLLGTVAKITDLFLTVEYDRGGIERVPTRSARVVSVRNNAPVSRRPLTLAEVKALRRVTRSVRVPVTKAQQRLIQKYGIPFLFDAAKLGGDREKLRYMLAIWLTANRKHFGSGLKRPRFVLTEPKTAGSMAMNGYTLGYWARQLRTMALSRRAFTAHEGIVLDVMLHEMAHQAVTDIDKQGDGGPDAHGPLWQAWMKKVGLPVDARKRPSDMRKFMTEREWNVVLRRQQKINKTEDLPDDQKRLGQPAAVLTEQNQLRAGKIAGFFDHRVGKVAAIVPPTGNVFLSVPVENLLVPPEKSRLPNDAQFLRFVEYVKRTKQATATP